MHYRHGCKSILSEVVYKNRCAIAIEQHLLRQPVREMTPE